MPLFGHNSLPPTWKLGVCRSLIQSIVLYAMERAQLSNSQLTRVNHVHFRSFRRIFGIKSSYYHRVLNPTTADRSNEYLSGVAYDTLCVVSPSQIYSQNRLALLGHLCKHENSIEYHATSMSAGRYRQVRGPARAGRPRLHLAESTMTEALSQFEHESYTLRHSSLFFSGTNIESSQNL